MNLFFLSFFLSIFQVCFSARAYSPFVNSWSAAPTRSGSPLSLKNQVISKYPQVALNPNYPSHLRSVPELCFVVAKMAFKSMCEFNEKLSAEDLKNYNSGYLNGNDSYPLVGNKAYEELLNKTVTYYDGEDYRTDALCNVLTKLGFSELLNLDLTKCSAELVLIIRIVALLGECDNRVRYLTYKMRKFNSPKLAFRNKIDVELLAKALNGGQIECSEDFVKGVNQFGREKIRGWREVVFENCLENNGEEFKSAMAKIKNFAIYSKEENWSLDSTWMMSILFFHQLFPLLRKEIEYFIANCPYRSLVRWGKILLGAPKEVLHMVISSDKIKLSGVHISELKILVDSLCPNDQELLLQKLISEDPSIREKLLETPVGSEDIKLTLLVSNCDDIQYKLEISNHAIHIVISDDKSHNTTGLYHFNNSADLYHFNGSRDGTFVFLRKGMDGHKSLCWRRGVSLGLEEVDGDEFFIVINPEPSYGSRFLDSCPFEMLDFLAYNHQSLDHWRIERRK